MDTPDRVYPRGRALKSTKAYVKAYYRDNKLGDLDKLFEPLSSAPTVWPDNVGIPDLRGIV